MSDAAGRWGATFQVYAGIELFIWMPALYATCYTFQPTARLMQTKVGRSSVERMAGCLQRHTPSYHETLVRLSSKIYGAPRTRAFAEWALLMKVLAPVAFPLKMYIAHAFVERSGWWQHKKGGNGGVQDHLDHKGGEKVAKAATVADSSRRSNHQPPTRSPPPASPPPAPGEANEPQAATALALRRGVHPHTGHVAVGGHPVGGHPATRQRAEPVAGRGVANSSSTSWRDPPIRLNTTTPARREPDLLPLPQRDQL